MKKNCRTCGHWDSHDYGDGFGLCLWSKRSVTLPIWAFIAEREPHADYVKGDDGASCRTWTLSPEDPTPEPVGEDGAEDQADSDTGHESS